MTDEQVIKTLGLRHHDIELIDSLWTEYRPFAERGFACRFSTLKDVQAMFWEMYLTCVLLQEGLDVQELTQRKRGRLGPDVLVHDQGDGGKRIWFEAHAPGCGEGDDAIPDFTGEGCHDVPDRETTLRYTSSLREKAKAFERYLKDETSGVRSDDACVIAINAGSIPTRYLEDGIPRITKAVLPFGVPIAHIDLKTRKVVDETYAYRPELDRSKGAAAPTTFFENSDNAFVSAVLFSYMPYVPMEGTCRVNGLIGHDLILVHNPLAHVRVRRGLLSVGREFWVEGDRLQGHTMPSSK